jgi:hypothetical protein
MTEGEAWAHEQLERLRRARFAPAAIVAFFAASFERSAEVRRDRPALARQARGWLALGALPWLAAGRRGLRGLAWWAAVALMLDWHLGMVETEDGRARPLSAGDALTLARAWLVPVAARAPTPAVCALAAATDALDGPLARRVGPTRAGRDLEGMVDACFAIAALRGARRRGWLGRRAVGAELLRLAAGFAYALLVYFGRARPPDQALTRAARATTPIRAGGLVAAGCGRRRLGETLVVGGALAGVVALGRALGRRPG